MVTQTRKTKLTLVMSFLLIFCIALSMPPMSLASELIHTIQTGSFSSEKDARKHYQLVMEKLSEEESDYLRIEKIGGYYAVRFGKFESFGETKHLLQSVRQKFAAILVVKAYIKDERLVTMYRSKAIEDKRVVGIEVNKELLKNSQKEQTAREPSEKKDRKIEAAAYQEKRDQLIKKGECSPLAIDTCKKIVKQNVNMAEAYYNLGIAYSKTGMYEYAIEAYEKARTLKPGFLQAHYNAGIAYSKAGKYEDSIRAYEDAIRIKPDFAKAYYNLGIAYSKTGMYKDAIDAYMTSAEINPHYAEAHYNLGIAYSKTGMHEKAIQAYKDAVSVNSEYIKAYYNLGAAYSEAGMYDEAIKAYERAVDLNPNYTEAQYNLEIANNKSGMKKYAVNAP